MSETRGQLPNRDTVTRNFLAPLSDWVGKARPSGRASRYRMVRRIGKGVSVKRRMTGKGCFTQAGGVALIAVGVAASILGLFTNLSLAGGQPVALMIAGVQATTVGVILVCYQQLLIRTSRNEEALRFQHDIGYEEGYRDRGREIRPTLIDLDAHRPCPCGSGKPQKTAVKAGDRV